MTTRTRRRATARAAALLGAVLTGVSLLPRHDVAAQSVAQIVVKVEVFGTEPSQYLTYPMQIQCSTPRAAAWLSDGALYLDVGPGNYLRAGNLNWYDVRTTSVPARGPDRGILGSAFNIASFGYDANGVNTVAAAAAALNAANPLPPVNLEPSGGQTGFTGRFEMQNGQSKTFGISEFPGLATSSACDVTLLDNRGAATSFGSTSTNANLTVGPVLPGVQVPATLTTPSVFKSALTKMGQTITVTNRYSGDLVVSTVVSGDPRSAIATFQVSVACDKGGPNDTFLLKDRQSKRYTGIPSGATCFVTETKTDGAIVTLTDNSGGPAGLLAHDGAVTIRTRGAACPDIGSPTPAVPGGPSPSTTFDDCISTVVITNTYGNDAPIPTTVPRGTLPPGAPPLASPALINLSPTASSASSASSASPAAATAASLAPPTASPAVDAAPAQAVEGEPAFTG